MIRLLPFLVISAFVHVLAAAGVEQWMSSRESLPGISEEPRSDIYVTVISKESSTAQAARPSAQSSAASQPNPPSEAREEKPTPEQVDAAAPATSDDTAKTKTAASNEPLRTSQTEHSTPEKPLLALLSAGPDAVADRDEPLPEPVEELLNKDAKEEEPAPVKDTQEKPDRETKKERKQTRSTQKSPSHAALPQVESTDSSFDASAERDLIQFRDKILDAVRRATFYPRRAYRKKRHGEVLVSFAVARDGSLQGVSIAQSSESEILDRAAIRIVKKAAREFPSIPETCLKDNIQYVLPIVFKKRR